MARHQASENGAVGIGSNVSDATLQEFYDKARKSKRELEFAEKEAEPFKLAVKSKLGEHRAIFKAAKKAGVIPEALARVLAMERIDADVILAEERQTVRLMAKSGQFPSIQTSLFDGLDLEPPEGAEADKMAADRAYDEGFYCGKDGKNRDLNKHEPGSEIFDAWDRGWLAGQRPLVASLAPKGRKPGKSKAKLTVVQSAPEPEAPAADDMPAIEEEAPFE